MLQERIVLYAGVYIELIAKKHEENDDEQASDDEFFQLRKLQSPRQQMTM